MKKLLSILLTICLMLTVLPFGVFNLTVSAATEYTNGYFDYIISNGMATIVDCDASISGVVNIPENLDGYPVNKIGDGLMVFYGCNEITEINIPDSVITISKYAFKDCINLKKVHIGEGVKTIEDYAFSACISIESIDIPDSVTTLGYYAFYMCSNAKSIAIGSGLKDINFSFFNCSSVEKIEVSNKNQKFHSAGNCLIETSSNTLLLGSTKGVIPNYVTYIESGSFQGMKGLTDIKIPDSVLTIRAGAFWNTGITELVIPKNVQLIGEQFFCNFDGTLRSITVDDENAFYHSKDNCLIDTYDNCLILGSNNSIIPRYIKSIANYAFFYSGIKSINVPKSVKSIGDYAFYGSKLITVYYSGDIIDRDSINIGSNNNIFKDANWYYSRCANGSVNHSYATDFDGDCELCGCVRNVPFSGGNGTKTNPYLIQNKYQLNNVRNHLSSHFKLIDDIEFTESDFDKGGLFYNSGTKWQPIGDSSNYFTGSFDGDKHSIVNLEILYAENDSFGFAGLFYGNEGTIKNLKLENVWLSGGSILSSQTATLGFIAGANDSTGVIDNCIIDDKCGIASIAGGNIVVGGITGTNYGNVTNCENNTRITSVSSSNSPVYFGGIVGINSDGVISHCKNNSFISAYGFAENKTIFVGGIVGGISKGSILNCINFENINGNYSSSSYKSNSSVAGIAGTVTGKVNIKNCANYGEITAYGYYSTALAGGIVGLAGNDNIEIRECFNVGKISATNNGSTKSAMSGGLCGYYNGTMYDSYNCGQVSADDYVGGIVGSMDGTCVLNNSYNAGKLVLNSSNGYIGGIVGGRIAGSYFECHYLNNTYSPVGLGGTSGSAKSNTIEEMKSSVTFSNFNFETVWTMNGNPDYLYPELKNVEMIHVPYVLGDIDGVEGVTDADAEWLLMYTFFPDDYPVNQDCDFNGDGFVNDADAEHLLMYTFFPEDYPLH